MLHIFIKKQANFEHFGLKVKDLSYDWGGVQKYKSDVVAKNSAGVTYLMKKNKVTVFNGFGKIVGQRKGRGRSRRRQERDDRDKEHHHRHRLGRAADPGF